MRTHNQLFEDINNLPNSCDKLKTIVKNHYKSNIAKEHIQYSTSVIMTYLIFRPRGLI